MLHTPDDHNYQYITDASGLTHLNFEVKASNDAHLGLSAQQNDLPDMYEIVIGGWANAKSGIRRTKGGTDLVTVDTPDILLGTEFRGFWVSWNDGTIKVGRAGESFPFMEWTDPNPLAVNYIGYSTGWGSTGEFRFCTEYGK